MDQGHRDAPKARNQAMEAGWRSDEGRARFYAGLWISHCLMGIAKDLVGAIHGWRRQSFCHELPPLLRRLLHRAVDQQSYPRHA
ncbi:hypothetical protein [Roseateles noduli]|jgi:hypothetical protein|uniref:hypothetical protein n=1 Tax=Roseateles noduli TaxID=2052484 RepID=UPI003D646A5F